jgi:hypothetical protein
VYFYLGESFLKARRKEEALVYFDRLVMEFQVSEHSNSPKSVWRNSRP